MKALRGTAALRKLREQPLWKLLAAHRAPVIVALLQSLFMDNAKSIPGSVLLERLTRDLEQLSANGEELAQTPQTAVAEWLAQGWLVRRLPPGATEEEYELSAEALTGIRFITGALRPRTTTTESRLSLVIQQLARLAEETDANPASRLDALRAERDRIDRQISDIERHGVRALADERALERAREVIMLAEELTGDFRSVRDEFDRLNRGLRKSLMENEGSRGDVLEALFAGVDIIGESDAGRTFNAFWRLLTDSEQSASLMESLDAVTSRSFARSLDSRERKFLLSLTKVLLDEGAGVHDVLQNFARSLKTFVQSREFLEQRRLHSLLKQATGAALAAKEHVRANQGIDYSLELTSSKVRSVSQWAMYDPAQRVVDPTMAAAEPSDLDLDIVSELLRQSEIDFRTLRQHVRAVLDEQTQASVAQVLQRFPAEQGLGSIVGYISLGAKHGEVVQAQSETVAWTGDDGVERSARVPTVYFLREKYHELVE